MPKSLQSQLAYTGGEVSPLMDARADHPKYQASCRQLQNMIALRQGAATRRPGLRRIAPAKYPDANLVVRLMEFQFSPATSFIMEFGHYYVRFYSNQQRVMVTDAPVWVSGTTYQPGAFVKDPTAGNAIYYYNQIAGGVPLTSTIAPSAAAFQNWVAQTIYEVPSPYPADSGYGAVVLSVTPCQINDVVYLVHEDYPPWKLTRYGDTDWRMEMVSFSTPPLLDQNATGIYIAATATTGSVTLSANAAAWAAGTYYKVGDAVNPGTVPYICKVNHVSSPAFATDLTNGKWEQAFIFNNGQIGGFFQLSHIRDSDFIEIDITADGTSGVLTAVGPCDLSTYGTWTADVELQRSLDGGATWQTIQIVTSRNDHNAAIEVEVGVTALFRLVVDNWVSAGGTTTPRAVFTARSAFVHGLVQITAVANAYDATALVVKELYSTDTTKTWSEGAWSAYRGYPRALTIFQQRAVYGGSEYEPQRIWGSVTNDLENFTLGDQTRATDSFAFDIAAVGRGPIEWLIGQVDLFAGFMGAEWIINAGSGAVGGSTSPITPTQIAAGEHSAWGSAPGVPPEVVGNAVLYTQRSAKTIQQMLFSVYTNKYMSNDLTSLSEHLFTAGIVQMAYQPQFRNQGIVWIVQQGGALCGMTYQIEQEVYAWHRHISGWNPETETLDAIESVACIGGQGSEDDEVWVAVDRPGGRSIELMNPVNWETEGTPVKGIAQPDMTQAFYVDSGITVTSPATNVITGLDHLEGRAVVGLVNGNIPVGPMTVSGGSVEISGYEPQPGDVVHVGLPIYYAVQGMRMDVDARAGFLSMVMKAVSRVYLRVLNSLGGKIRGNGDKVVPINYRAQSLPIDQYPPLYTGDREVVPQSTQTYDPIMIVEGSDALPLTLLATTVRDGITGSA